MWKPQGQGGESWIADTVPILVVGRNRASERRSGVYEDRVGGRGCGCGISDVPGDWGLQWVSLCVSAVSSWVFECAVVGCGGMVAGEGLYDCIARSCLVWCCVVVDAAFLSGVIVYPV